MNTARSIRIFLSSTFGDMQAERNELVGRVFPRLRQWLAPLGVDLVEIDLRWGVPREHPYSLLACLEEVDACHPFFLCFLGHQCGSLVSEKAIPPPQSLTPQLRADHERLRQFVGRSYTEVEIWRAVLSRDPPSVEALFYFRARSLSDALLAQIETSLVGRPNSVSPGNAVADWARRQLEAAADRAKDPEQLRQAEELRRSIEQKVGPVPEYTSPEELGRMVEEDLRKRIGAVLNEPQELRGWRTPAPRWLALRSRRYFGEAGNLSRLSSALRRGGPVILWGTEGGGGTALLAAWARLAVGGVWTDPATVVLRSLWPGRAVWVERACRRTGQRFANRIWISAEALGLHADWRELVRWLVDELSCIAGEPVQAASTIREAELALRLLPKLLERVASLGRLLVIIDGLDHLGNAPHDDLLAWLPTTVPKGVSLLVSMREESKRREQAKWRSWRNVVLSTGSRRGRLHLMEGLLRLYGKDVRACGGADLVLRNVATVPRHLELLADWLRRAGYAGEAQARAQSVSAATTTTDFTAHLLRATARELKDLPELAGLNGEALFAEALGYLVLARGGLTETALRDLLGPAGEQLFAVAWVPILDRLKGFLTESAGRYVPQPWLVGAVFATWEISEAEKLARRRKLAAYFAPKLPDPESLREAPWQWFQAGDGAALLRFITQPKLFAAWLRARPLEAPIVWGKLERDNSRQFLEPYLERLMNEALNSDLLIEDACEIGVFVSECVPGAWRQHFWTTLQQRAAVDGTDVRLRWRCLAETARAHASLQQWREAEMAWRCLLEMQRQAAAHDALTESLVELSGLLEKLGRVAEAGDLMPELRTASEAAGDLWSRMSAARTRGRFFTRSDRKEDFQKALDCFRDAESCARLIGDVFEVIAAIGQQGSVLVRLEEYQPALDRHLEESRLAEQAGDKHLLQAALGGQAVVALARADFDKLEDLLERRKRLADETGDPLARMQTRMQYAQINLRWAESSREESRRRNEQLLAAEKCKDILRIAAEHGLEQSETAEWARQTRIQLGYSAG